MARRLPGFWGGVARGGTPGPPSGGRVLPGGILNNPALGVPVVAHRAFPGRQPPAVVHPAPPPKKQKSEQQSKPLLPPKKYHSSNRRKHTPKNQRIALECAALPPARRAVRISSGPPNVASPPHAAREKRGKSGQKASKRTKNNKAENHKQLDNGVRINNNNNKSKTRDGVRTNNASGGVGRPPGRLATGRAPGVTPALFGWGGLGAGHRRVPHAVEL